MPENLGIEKYPFVFFYLFRKIDNEKRYLTKYFLLLDLIRLINRYLCLLAVSCLNFKKKNKAGEKITYRKIRQLVSKNDFISLLNKSLKVLETQNDVFIEELKTLKKNSVWPLLQELLALLERETSSSLFSETVYRKKYYLLFSKVKKLLSEINFLTDYHLAIPYNFGVEKKLIFFMGANPLIAIPDEQIADLDNHFSFLLLKKNQGKILELRERYFNIGINTDFALEPEKIISSLLNSLHEFLTGSYFYHHYRFPEKDFPVFSDLKSVDSASATKNFIFREALTAKLTKFFAENKSGYLLVNGLFGVGKTTFLTNFLANKNGYDYTFFKVGKDLSFYSGLKSLCELISTKYNLSSKSSFGKKETDFVTLLHLLSEFKKKEIIIFEDLSLNPDKSSWFSLFPEKLPDNIYLFVTSSDFDNNFFPASINKEVLLIPPFSHSETTLFLRQLSGEEPDYFFVGELIRKTGGIPLYLKILAYEFYSGQNEFTLSFRKGLKSIFKSFFSSLKKLPVDKILVEKTALLLALAPEGFNKNELQQILSELTDLAIAFFLSIFSDFIFIRDGRILFAADILPTILLDHFKKTQILEAQLKIIDYFQPWDKKVSSLGIKYLPRHLLAAGKISDLFKLFNSNFSKTKFKIYPGEMLKDLELFIDWSVSNIQEISTDFLTLIYLYQNYRNEQKKVLFGIANFYQKESLPELLKKSESLDKSEERFYQLLIIAYLLASGNFLSEAKLVVKKMMLLNNFVFTEHNSGFIFKLCALIAGKGVLDVVNLPRSHNDAVNLLKNLPETFPVNKTLKIILSLSGGIINENERVEILDALISRTAKLKNFEHFNQLMADIFLEIEKIKNPLFSDRLYYSSISAFISKPLLYRKFINNLTNQKNKLKTPVFKFLYHGNLALIYNHLHEQKAGAFFIFRAFDFIKEINPESFAFVFKSIFASLHHFKNCEYYPDLLQRLTEELFACSDPDIKIYYLLKLAELETKKDLLKKIAILVTETNSAIFVLPLIKLISGIKDGRVKGPLIKKISTVAESSSDFFKISFFSGAIIYSLPTVFSETKRQKLLELIFNDSGSKNFLFLIDLFTFTEENEFTSTFFADLLGMIIAQSGSLDPIPFLKPFVSFLANRNNLKNRLKLLNTLLDFFTFDPEMSAEKITIISLISIINYNDGQTEPAFSLLHKLFASLKEKSEQDKALFIPLLLKNLPQLNFASNGLAYAEDFFTGIFPIIIDLQDEKIKEQLFSAILNFLPLQSAFLLKNIGYKILEQVNRFKINFYREQLLLNWRSFLVKINDPEVLIDLLQKSVLVSEGVFWPKKVCLLSVLSLALNNFNSGSLKLSRKCFFLVLEKLKGVFDEEYFVLVVSYFSTTLGKINQPKLATNLFRELLDLTEFISDEKRLQIVILDLVKEFSKIGDYKKINSLFSLSLERSLKIKNETIRAELISKIFSFATNFGFSEQNKKILEEIIDTLLTLSQENNLALFFRSILLSLNKLKTEVVLPYLERIGKKITSFVNPVIRSDLLSIIAVDYFRFRDSEKSKDFFRQAIEAIYEIKGSSNQIDSASVLLLRLIFTGNFVPAKSIIEFTIVLLENITNENERFEETFKFISRFTHLSFSPAENKYLSEKFINLLNFTKEQQRIRLFLLLGQIYHKNKEKELLKFYYDKAKELLNHLSVNNENIELLIDSAQALLRHGQTESGNLIFKKTILLIRSSDKKFSPSLLIKLFLVLTNLGEKRYDPEIMPELLEILQETSFKQFKDSELITLARLYASQNYQEQFFLLLNYLKNNSLKELILKKNLIFFIEREDSPVLFRLLPQLLNNPYLFDQCLAAILLFSEQTEDLKRITELLTD